MSVVSLVVAVAQLVEPWIVIPVVVGSSPISHPKYHAKEPQKAPFLLARLLFIIRLRHSSHTLDGMCY